MKSLQTILKNLSYTVSASAGGAPAKFSEDYLDSIKEDLVGAYVDLLYYFGVDVDPSDLSDQENPQFEDFDNARKEAKAFGSFGDYIVHAAWQYMADTFSAFVDDASDDPEAERVLNLLQRNARKAAVRKATRAMEGRHVGASRRDLRKDLDTLARAIDTCANSAPENVGQGYMDKAVDRIQDIADKVLEDCGLKAREIQADYDADNMGMFASTEDYIGHELWSGFYRAFDVSMSRSNGKDDSNCDIANSYAIDAMGRYNTQSWNRNESWSIGRRYW